MPMMITFRAGKVATIAVLLFLTTACSREQQDWRAAEGADTIDAYGHFLEQHPESELATQARARVAQLAEDRDWQHAGSADTSDAYRQFLSQHPNGKWSQEARIRIESFSLGGPPLNEPSGAVPARAQSSGGAPTAAPPVVHPATSAASAPVSLLGAPRGASSAAVSAGHSPRSTPARVASALPPSDGYGVQLGAFSSEEGATNEWRQLTARFGSELHGLSPHIISANTPSGQLYRLQAPVADEARARAICESLKKQSQACVPVPPAR
jgi:cell division septation protein DedD